MEIDNCASEACEVPQYPDLIRTKDDLRALALVPSQLIEMRCNRLPKITIIWNMILKMHVANMQLN